MLFVVAALMSHPDPGALGKALVTWTPLPSGSLQLFLLLVASNIGATITPWMLFFQQSAVADKGVTPRDLGHSRFDTALGAALAAVAGIGSLVVASALFYHHVDPNTLQGGAGFAEALRPILGYPVAAIFSLGLIEAGALAMMTISASTAYAVGEALGGPHSFNRKIGEARGFYAFNVGISLVAALIVLIPGAPLLSIALNANVLATVLLPVSLVFMVMLANDKGLMGHWVNRRLTNVIGISVIAFVGICGAAYGIDSFLLSTHVIGP
jgi:Mn2+/Fe2+ NRAMP family transporter